MTKAQKGALARLKETFEFEWFYVHYPLRSIKRGKRYPSYWYRKHAPLAVVASVRDIPPPSYRLENEMRGEVRIEVPTFKSLLKRSVVTGSRDSLMCCVRCEIQNSRIQLLFGDPHAKMD